tara:strand:- start:172 stop:306 length:135 start_codon:yes stop_codon:yes gene_type:complete
MKYTIVKDQNNFYHILVGKTQIGFFHTHEDAINHVQELIKKDQE